MSNTYRVKVNNNQLLITRNDQQDPIWGEELEFLNEVRNDGGDNFSEVIMQLSEKNWVNIDLLYEVATYIQQNHPGNDIDWFATFSLAEHLDTLNHSFDLKQEFEKKKQSAADDTFDLIDFARGIEKEERRQSDEIVKQKLTQYKLPYKAD